MPAVRIGVTLLILASALAPLAAQAPESLTPAQIALACAAPGGPPPAAPVRILGAQDPLPHTLLAPHELLIIGGGTDDGLQLGQQFFVRHAPLAGAYGYRRGRGAATMALRGGAYAGGASTPGTAGWLRIVAVNRTTAVATVEHACDGIFQNDYLEPFEAPSVPANADRDDSSGEPDFTSLARVTAAPENHWSAGPGEYVVIDRGRNQQIESGARLAIYRDLRTPAMPLTPLGEAVVMSAGADTSLVRINRARDAVLVGDYLAPRK
jgi:hypothetical protein